MNRLTQFSMKNITAVLIIIVILFGGGLYSAMKLKVENLPDISLPMVMVTTTYQASPMDVMEEVTKPIEEKLANIDGIDTLSSRSNENVSSITVMFETGVDIDKKKQDIESLLQDVKLPTSAGTPKASTFGFASMPAYYLVVKADGMSQTELDKVFEDQIKPGFQGIKGIDHLESIGTRETSMDIEMNADALNTYQLSPSQVSAAIRAALNNGSVGTVEVNGNEKMARISGDLDSLYNLEQMEITTGRGDTVQLNQIAKINAVADSDFMARLDGKPGIGIELYKTSSANAVEFSDSADKLMKDWKTTLPNVEFKSIFNSADSVKESINGMLKEGIAGALLASLMILIFLRNMRMTLIVLVSIPLSILITLMLMKQLGITLNIMTLGGMFIAVGRVVDDSIVVIENIYSELQKAHERNESVIAKATKQVAMAITSSTLATVGVFAPIGMVSGIAGQFFRPFAITLGCALLASLLVALTVIPMLAKLLVLGGKKVSSHDEHAKGKVTARYEKILVWSLNNRIKTLLISGLLFIVSLVTIIPNLAVAFQPAGSEPRAMYYQIKLPNNTSIQATDEQSKALESMFMDAKDTKGEPLFDYVEALVGYSGGNGMPGGIGTEQVPNMMELYVEVNANVDPAKVKDEYKQIILADLPKGSEVTPRSLEGGGSTTTDFSYSLKGDDQKQLEQAAAAIKAKLQTYPELSEVEDSLSDSKTEVNIQVDQRRARAYGLSAAQVRDTVRSWIQKDNLGDIKLDGIIYKTNVVLNKEDKNSIEKLGKIPLKAINGSTIYLNEIANISEQDAAVSIARDHQQQVVTITAKVDSKDKGGVVNRITADLLNVDLPSGVIREVKGVTADIQESFSQLFVAMGVSVAVVFLVMVLAFGNASAPFAILFSLPLAAIGGLLGLLLSGESLNITSLIGFMMLIGIVVTNAIVLLDRAQQLREQGYTVRHALVEAGMVRLRPILMTAGATIVALIPLASGLTKGTLISKGLAVVVIGGLTTSTLLTLVVVPIVYELIESIKSKVARRMHREQAAPANDRNALGM
ncbi:efflux RND transporter permease subunit [Paenibacillus cremeus]|uniref:Efflux RND transporter permease subunit n=1 Tax=Paenibacillus cremeus TaxID=2163881 RepID=A0A559K6Q5_9BACL|nr:efflux RND transporter permease subunit [Paenibacillus cremeus]TVY07794.1 efflux RND transporter permease subunit [Paenibacillus cremeus]